MDLVGAVRVSRLEGLVALRDLLAEMLSEEDVFGAAALVKQLREVLAEIDVLSGVKGSKIDDLARRRAVRRSGTEG